MIVSSRLTLLTLLISLTACSSPAVRYHTLVPAGTTAPAAAEPAAFLINLLPVGIPPQIDMAQLVVRQGDNQALVLDNERWLSPLGDEMRSAISAELVRQLGTQDVAGLSAPAGAPLLNIQIQIRKFDSWPSQRVQLAADWSLTFRHQTEKTRLLCSSQLTESVAGGYSEMLQAQQKILVRLATQIAANARHWTQDPQMQCLR
ncbi:membrane integrity-associated transporter subunit PqiC [Pantoea sp. B65]|uniref:PqiC family protein n=1 Tax=Pantoea sp. B65 TaxID=2813359 RepID=UPI0039B5A682